MYYTDSYSCALFRMGQSNWNCFLYHSVCVEINLLFLKYRTLGGLYNSIRGSNAV